MTCMRGRTDSHCHGTESNGCNGEMAAHASQASRLLLAACHTAEHSIQGRCLTSHVTAGWAASATISIDNANLRTASAIERRMHNHKQESSNDSSWYTCQCLLFDRLRCSLKKMRPASFSEPSFSEPYCTWTCPHTFDCTVWYIQCAAARSVLPCCSARAAYGLPAVSIILAQTLCKQSVAHGCRNRTRSRTGVRTLSHCFSNLRPMEGGTSKLASSTNLHHTHVVLMCLLPHLSLSPDCRTCTGSHKPSGRDCVNHSDQEKFGMLKAAARQEYELTCRPSFPWCRGWCHGPAASPQNCPATRRWFPCGRWSTPACIVEIVC